MRRLSPCLLLAGLCLLAGCSTVAEHASPTPAGTQSAPPAPTASAPPEPVWGEQVYQTTFYAEGREEAVFSPEYRLPHIDNAQGVPAYEAINAYYTGALEDLAVSAAELSGWAVEDSSLAQTLGDPFFPYVDTEGYEIAMETSSRVSVLRSHSSNSGGPYPTLYPVGDTFDLTTGARLAFADLFSCGAQEAAERVLSAVLAKNADQGYRGSVLEEDALKSAYRPEQFYLTEDSFTVYFPAGDLPKAVGSPTFAVPYTELEDILRPWE